MLNKEGTIIDLVRITDPRGNLTVAEGMKDVPFSIARAYWVYDVPAGECRGGHAHKHCDGRERHTFLLNHPYQGLLIDTGVWRTLDDFSSGAVCLVLASDPFSEDDYIRDYDEFRKYAAGRWLK